MRHGRKLPKKVEEIVMALKRKGFDKRSAIAIAMSKFKGKRRRSKSG